MNTTAPQNGAFDCFRVGCACAACRVTETRINLAVTPTEFPLGSQRPRGTTLEGSTLTKQGRAGCRKYLFCRSWLRSHRRMRLPGSDGRERWCSYSCGENLRICTRVNYNYTPIQRPYRHSHVLGISRSCSVDQSIYSMVLVNATLTSLGPVFPYNLDIGR